MGRTLFLRAFSDLLSRWTVYQDAPRDPARVVELAGARMDLDDARRSVAEARGAWEIHRPPSHLPVVRTSVSEDDLARLRVQIFPS